MVYRAELRAEGEGYNGKPKMALRKKGGRVSIKTRERTRRKRILAEKKVAFDVQMNVHLRELRDAIPLELQRHSAKFGVVGWLAARREGRFSGPIRPVNAMAGDGYRGEAGPLGVSWRAREPVNSQMMRGS